MAIERQYTELQILPHQEILNDGPMAALQTSAKGRVGEAIRKLIMSIPSNSGSNVLCNFNPSSLFRAAPYFHFRELLFSSIGPDIGLRLNTILSNLGTSRNSMFLASRKHLRGVDTNSYCASN